MVQPKNIQKIQSDQKQHAQKSEQKMKVKQQLIIK